MTTNSVVSLFLSRWLSFSSLLLHPGIEYIKVDNNRPRFLEKDQHIESRHRRGEPRISDKISINIFDGAAF